MNKHPLKNKDKMINNMAITYAEVSGPSLSPSLDSSGNITAEDPTKAIPINTNAQP